MSTQPRAIPDWPEIEISRAEQFQILDRRAREIEEITKTTWLELAELCVTMRDNQLWREGGYHSFTDMLNNSCPPAQSTAYAAIGTLAQLTDISEHDVIALPHE